MILRVKDLKKYYGARGEIKAVDGVSFDVEEGEIFALLGPNGAGKTTTIKCILGLRKPTSGTVEVHGTPVCYVPEGKELYENYSVERMVDFASELTDGFDKDVCNALIEEFGIPRRERISNLSNGEHTLLYLALALAQRAKLYIFDEPTWGLDPIMRNRVLEKIRYIPIHREGAAVLYTSHILSEVEKIADRVAIMSRGRILELDHLDDLKKKFCTVTLRRGTDVRNLNLILYKSTQHEDVYVTLVSEAERAGLPHGPASLEIVFEALVLSSKAESQGVVER